MGDEGFALPRQRPQGPLEIGMGRQWRFYRVVAIPGAVSAVRLFFGHGADWWASLFLCVLIVVLWVSMLLRQWRWRAKGALLRIDERGLTIVGRRTVPWADIAEVRLTRKSSWEGVVFVGRPGVELPCFRIVLLTVRRPDRAARKLAGQWGSPLVLFPTLLDVPAQGIIDAVHRYAAGIPIHGATPYAAAA
ncbi:PH domain-containing protein [Actinacidiphila yeochonensis]|uniref:PH domain-containing protein n=1 Tax=Actinacidiphila yeochonensis TaxID=89050 RepID=UPI0005662E54|nr:PH domain-containing protein [Actinacidiphila yeochonensis]